MPTCIPIDHTTDYEQWHALWKAYLEFYNTELPEEQYRDTFSRLVDPDGDLGGFVLVLTDEEVEDEVEEDETKADDEGEDRTHRTHRPRRYIGLAHYLTHTSAWSPASTRHCYLNDLYVDPAVRGTGGGRMLIEAVQEEAKAKLGCSRVYWLTAPDNAAARRLYDKVAVTNRVAYKIDL